ncbi:Periplasmic serine endoprotease DegP precursor [Enhygromyxa salina]|uniref:Periplasmic serine endoprotease DegP n=1 Tax=Enhygromyxa salina TaxID=215803 RepID=A0A2S9YKZ8_9BACT|nr:trypsin-like peptidase domain-containing protein [Enhygromyxa salina]PRQ05706.1 Periplasmic serine endoprotease DegP precursor [Enhygromyxa salina]
MSERDPYPFWVAMGAAFVGTLLGGGAVWIGVNRHLDEVERAAAQELRAAEAVDAAEPEPEPEPEPKTEPKTEEVALDPNSPSDPGDSPLVRALERTRDSVVSIELGGRPAGAGVVYDASGTLLTNYHVIEPVLRARLQLGDPGAVASIRVRFVDGRERSAKVLAADPDEDVAVLSVTPERADERFGAAPLGQSASLRLGEQVFAIGSPVGFEGTVATGIISSLQRTGVLAKRSLPVLQLDAAINFGNSGGPLFNLAGEIVGITTARSSRGEGIGFAIPIDRIRLFLRALEQGMRGRSGVIGVELDPSREISDAIAPLGYHSGVAVTGVDEGRAAALAGMQPGDVIVTLRGRRHDQLDASDRGRQAFSQLLGETIRGLLPGETLVVEVVRDGELHELEIVVEAASVERQARIDAEQLLGLALAPSGDEARIVGLVPSSPIARMRGAQLLAGARITSLFGQPVANLEQLGERLALLRSWSAGGGRRSISIGLELEGRSLTANNFPLATGR